MSDCLSSTRLEAYAAGRLMAEGEAAHLNECARCRAAADEIRQNNSFMPEVKALVSGRDGAGAGSGSADTLGRFMVSGRSGQEDACHPDAPPGYDICSVIARGGQGTVYLAKQRATRRQVALKVLGGGPFATPRERHRFEREIELVAGLRHSNIVTVYDGGTTPDGRGYFAMEYVEGPTLDRYLADAEKSARGRLAEREVLRLFIRICEAVNYAHQRGIIHRDLKPANIVVVEGEGPPSGSPSPQPKVIDFGLAKTLHGNSQHPGAAVTVPGGFQGTLAYAAPEQIAGDAQRVDTRTDVYALGVVLYEALTQSHPYSMVGPMTEILRRIAEDEPARPSSKAPGINDELDAIVLRALAKEPDRRYQTALEFGRDLDRYLAGEPVEARSDSTWYMLTKWVRRHKAPILVAAAFLALLTGFAAVMSIQARRLADHRNRLAISLSESNIERARFIGLSGNLPAAEGLLWREFLQGASGADVVGETSGRIVESSPAFWGLWELYARQPCLATLPRDSTTDLLGFDASGKHVLLADRGRGEIRTYDPPTGRIIGTRPGPGPSDGLTSFKREGGMLVATDTSGAFVFWDLSHDVSPRRLPTGGADRPLSSALSPDGRLLASGSAAGTIVLRDASSGVALATVHGHDAPVLLLHFSPDGQWLASTEALGRIRLWDVRSPGGLTLLHDVSEQLDMPVYPAMAFSADSRTLAYRRIHTLILWDVTSGRETRRIAGHGGNIGGFVFTSDNRRLAVGGYNGVVKIYDLVEDRWTVTFAGHTGAVSYMYFSPDARVLATSSLDGTVRLWESSVRNAPARFSDHSDSVLAADFAPDGKTLATAGGRDSSIRLRSVHEQQAPLVIGGHGRVAAAVAFHPSGQWLATGGHDARIRLWGLPHGDPRGEVVADRIRIVSLAFSPDGALLASGGDDPEVKLWRVGEGLTLERQLSGHAERISFVSISPDGRRLASTSRDETVRVWDVTTGEMLNVFIGHQGPVRCVRFSPDGRLLASSGDDGTVRIWDSSSGACLRILTGHAGEVYAVCFSPDGSWLASGDRGGNVRFWDPASGRSLAVLDGPRIVFSLSVSRDGRWLAVGGDRPTAHHLWDLTYFDRHIAGNLAFQLGRLESEPVGRDRIKQMRTWADGILGRTSADGE